jgi:hypothetical protein
MATQPASASSSPGTFGGTVRNVVLVHGAYADGSSWSEVIGRLQGGGLTATAVQNPLTSLADDVAHTTSWRCKMGQRFWLVIPSQAP